MNSIKTKTKKYTLINNKAIAGVLITPTANNSLMVYVVWEQVKQAEDYIFAISGAAVEHTKFSYNNLIDYVADYGMDVTHIKEIRQLFPTIFKN